MVWLPPVFAVGYCDNGGHKKLNYIITVFSLVVVIPPLFACVAYVFIIVFIFPFTFPAMYFSPGI